jgi:hypothetical protein
VTPPPLLELLLELLLLELLLELLELLLELELLELLLAGVLLLPPPQATTMKLAQKANVSARTEVRLRWRGRNECMCSSSIKAALGQESSQELRCESPARFNRIRRSIHELVSDPHQCDGAIIVSPRPSKL